ncbi:hypothetical protein B0J12DRAFT_694598 [Macrophomina phaseolina]|uniref:Uncharacterized protein n=1 Tax=Macrophomina phaseolina TaxID=35725 RepID=A0ABQ8GT79_9PEZI|nr:hypothetical protein B0J12DRAFT_694598 [Macrophomina phaseolina]
MLATHFYTAIFAILTATAAAKRYNSCTCHNGDSYNWRITSKACELHTQWYPGRGEATYDTPSGRCKVNDMSSGFFTGDQWEAVCQEIGKTGFLCASGSGTCFQPEASEVQGWCKNE